VALVSDRTPLRQKGNGKNPDEGRLGMTRRFSTITKLRCFSLTLIFLVAVGLPAKADIQLITNGNFATGDFTGWTETNQAGGNGNWFVSNSDVSPDSGYTTPGPFPGDSFYALTDQTGPGAHSLTQSFTVPVDTTSLTLSFEMFSDDQDGGPFCPGTLDYSVNPSQCTRVDILTAGAGAFDTGAGVVMNLYESATQTVGGAPNPWVAYSFDLSGLTPGDTYQLRFGEVDNQLFNQQGIDDVSILAVVATPEPDSLVLLGTLILCAGLGMASARRKKPLA
jgi:hypothetical protein